ncbi:uncharacterized protein EI97DRAFT_441357 [Westerdykella ornata]|uniref:DUF7918 domain-containing protein n=1 Tax=Westerdykella ornata TaxID=318751 RepID=A0A6A6JNK0_WESOR|nr:uncharacterized protein EI97DRAFT_441357 [Westerdykella ornata]KAF2278092.1 hypothetical protein EI97DRAFT_441357 [Westerdykella ornata]
MAVLDSYPGLEVEILVNGTPLQEYVDPDEEAVPDRVLKYIEATSNATFEIRCRFTSAFVWKHDLSLDVYTDGRFACGRIVYKLRNPSDYTTTFTGVRERNRGKCYVRPFFFSQLNIGESDAGMANHDLQNAIKCIGAIGISATWVKVKGRRRNGSAKTSAALLGTVSEKALKGRAVSHQTGLLERKPTASYKTRSTKAIGKEFATFNFRCRSKEALKALHIIPRSPSPILLELRDTDTLTFEEARELLRRQRDRERTVRAVKEEGNRKVKRERPDGSEDLVGGDQGDEVLFVSAKRRRTHAVISNDDQIDVIDLT